MEYALNSDYMIPLAYRMLPPSEIVGVFAGFDNGTIRYNGHRKQMDIYCRIYYDDEGYTTRFQYFGFKYGQMAEIGSGGYIPEFHAKEERLAEFELRRKWNVYKELKE